MFLGSSYYILESYLEFWFLTIYGVCPGVGSILTYYTYASGSDICLRDSTSLAFISYDFELTSYERDLGMDLLSWSTC
jgi:hypothetical protein